MIGAKKKPINPLMSPLKGLLKMAQELQAIPGFASETLQLRIREAETAIKNEKQK